MYNIVKRFILKGVIKLVQFTPNEATASQNILDNKKTIDDAKADLKSCNIYLIVRMFMVTVLYFTSINKAFYDNNASPQMLFPTYLLFFLPLSIEYWFSIKTLSPMGNFTKKISRILCPGFLVALFIVGYGGIPSSFSNTSIYELIFRYLPIITILFSIFDWFFYTNPDSTKCDIALSILEEILNNNDINKLQNKDIKDEIEITIRGRE